MKATGGWNFPNHVVMYWYFILSDSYSFLKSHLCSQRKVSSQIHVFLIFFPVVFSPEECFTYVHMLKLLFGIIQWTFKTSSGNMLRATKRIKYWIKADWCWCDDWGGTWGESRRPVMVKGQEFLKYQLYWSIICK